MLFKGSVAMVIAAILSVGAARAGETKRPPLDDPGAAAAGSENAKEKKKTGLEIDKRFSALVDGKFSERAEAFTAALARAHELSAAARAEAARLRALPEVDKAGHAGMLDWLLGCLDAIVAEETVIRSWKKGLSKEAAAISGRTVDLTCKNSPAADVLRRASAGWGQTFELSPAAKRLNAGLEMSINGSPSLEQFIDWMAGTNDLVCGHAGGKLVLVPPASVKLAENIEKDAKEKPPAGK